MQKSIEILVWNRPRVEGTMLDVVFNVDRILRENGGNGLRVPEKGSMDELWRLRSQPVLFKGDGIDVYFKGPNIIPGGSNEVVFVQEWPSVVIGGLEFHNLPQKMHIDLFTYIKNLSDAAELSLDLYSQTRVLTFRHPEYTLDSDTRTFRLVR